MATFAEKYAPKYDKAVDCLLKDRVALLTFFGFLASGDLSRAHRPGLIEASIEISIPL